MALISSKGQGGSLVPVITTGKGGNPSIQQLQAGKASGEFTTEMNTTLLREFGFKGQAGAGRGAQFLRDNPNVIDAVEAKRRTFKGQENYSADDIRKSAISTGQQAQGLKTSSVTGAAVSKKQFDFEQSQLGGLQEKIFSTKNQLSAVTDAKGKEFLSMQLDNFQKQYDQIASGIRTQQNEDWRRGGAVQAITPEEKALRDAGYQGNFGQDAERYKQFAGNDFAATFSGALEKRTAEQKVISDRISAMGSLRDFLKVGAFSQPGDVNGMGAAFDPTRFGGSDIGKRLAELDAITLAKLGLTGIKAYGSIVDGGTAAIDAFGAEVFGTANVSNSFVGPLQAGQTAGTTLSNVFGGAGTGASIGALYAQLTGAKSTGATIGGAAGGVVGAVALGGLSGVSVGATLGSIVPGIGTVIGAVAGAILGGFFGAGKINPGATFAGEVLDGKFGFSTKSKHMDATGANNLGTIAQAFMDNLAASTGYTLDGMRLSGGFGQGQNYFNTNYKTEPGTLFSDDKTVNRQFSFDPNDAQSILRAQADVTVDFLAKNDGEVRQLLSEGVQSLDILAAAQARFALANPSKAPETAPPVISATPESRIAASTAAATAQFETFIKATEAGKTGQQGTILTSNSGLMDRPTTRRSRIRADFTPDMPGFGIEGAAYA
jgi:hypothetical protein